MSTGTTASTLTLVSAWTVTVSVSYARLTRDICSHAEHLLPGRAA